MADAIDGRVVLREGMAFDATPTSGHTIRMDAAPSVGGQDQGARPLELLLLGLGGCTGMDVISILRKMRQAVTGYEILLHAERAEEHPRIFTKIVVEHVVRGRDLSESAVRKAVSLSEKRYCSASAMLSKTAAVEHRIRLVAEDALLAVPES
ncbi:MAG: OsmC family protein [Chloroflexota bacterium]